MQDDITQLKNKIQDLEKRLEKLEKISLPPSNDELLKNAKDAVMEYEMVSASLLQRKLGIGYARASRLMDQLEAVGIVGPGIGAKPRKVIRVNKV